MAENINSHFDLNEKEKDKMLKFFYRLKEAAEKLRDREIKPVAIISISIPNGKLTPHYDKEIVSGKSYGKSIRYHYRDGKFKLLVEDSDVKSRVVFLDFNKDYSDKLAEYFTTFYVFETKQKKIKSLK